jgi:uncharacterized protein (TIGR02594 family)
MLPRQYAWLAKEPGPQMLLHALAIYGTREFKGAADNPVILAWAEECGIRSYIHDSTAWCGLAMAVCAKRAGWEFNPSGNALWARNWSLWGTPIATAMLGDVLVFPRGDAGHVALYVGEDDAHYHCLGGNQSDMVNIVRKPKRPILAIRRAPWRIAQPANVRVVRLSSTGIVSTKET